MKLFSIALLGFSLIAAASPSFAGPSSPRSVLSDRPIQASLSSDGDKPCYVTKNSSGNLKPVGRVIKVAVPCIAGADKLNKQQSKGRYLS